MHGKHHIYMYIWAFTQVYFPIRVSIFKIGRVYQYTACSLWSSLYAISLPYIFPGAMALLKTINFEFGFPIFPPEPNRHGLREQQAQERSNLNRYSNFTSL